MQKNYRSRQSTLLLLMVGLWILVLPTTAFAVEDFATTVIRDADSCTVHIILQIGVDGDSTDSATIKNALDSLGKVDTCKIPCPDPSTKKCSVDVTVDVKRWADLDLADTSKYHRVKMVPGDSAWAYINAPNGPKITDASGISGKWGRNNTWKVYCHEALHLSGLDDTYCELHSSDYHGSRRVISCPDPPGPDPCDCDTINWILCTRPCNNHWKDLMATTACSASISCDHILGILALAGNDANGHPLNTCPVDPCCEDTAETGCCQFSSYCDMMTEDDCTDSDGTWYPSPPYECIDDLCRICADDPNDLGERDTLHVETFDCDHVYEAEPGSFDSVRVAIYVTHDSNSFYWEPHGWVQDSIACFVIPLTFWHQPEGCADSVILPAPGPPDWWNNTANNSLDGRMGRSIFRNLVDTHTGDTTYNRMLWLGDNYLGWATRIIDIEPHSSDGDSGHMFLSLIPGPTDRRWWEGSRVLLATLTFHVYMSEDCDTTEIGIDSTLWPPAGHLTFTRHDGVQYTPCHVLPVKETIYVLPELLCGDCNGDGIGDVGDVIYLINYLFTGTSAPDPLCIGDVNCDSLVDVGDVIYLINYLFTGTSPPCSECCDLKAKMEEFPGQTGEGDIRQRRPVPQRLPETLRGLKRME